jgi:hypothetical protein
MMRRRPLLLALTALGLLGYIAWVATTGAPPSATLPEWTQGEFGASAERYAGRIVRVNATAISFSRGAEGADSMPIKRIEEIVDVRSHVRIFDLHVQDAGSLSKIRLIASSTDSSFRLQTMPDVAWRRLTDREARTAHLAALIQPTSDSEPNAPNSPRDVAQSPAFITSTNARAPQDTVIGAQRFADRDPVAREELMHLIAACRGAGCRIGVRGLVPNQFMAFAGYLRKLGADSVVLSAQTTSGVLVTMLDIVPARH